MKFSVYLPHCKENEKLKCLFFLSGLTCNEDNFITKASALKKASDLGLILVCPDTSPRGLGIPGEDDSWDFGLGAGFYVDAKIEKWSRYKMYSYIVSELVDLVKSCLPVDAEKIGIFGHSMGGHGAIVIGLRNPRIFKSISAFAPISNPINCPWGHKAFTGYLGDDLSLWKMYDSSELIKTFEGPKREILIDQGTSDSFLTDQLKPENILKASESNDLVDIKIRMQEGYDHSYWFIQTFIEDHLEFHNEKLKE